MASTYVSASNVNPPKKRTDGLVYSMSGYNPAFSLPANYNFSDLASYEQRAREAYGQRASEDILSTRDRLATSLGDYGQKFFQEQNPAILEDLNARGLLTSPTGVNQAQADALKSIALENQKYLRDFDTSALSARLQAEQDALDTGANLRSTGLEANINEAQAQREERMARDLADKQSRNNLNNALIGAGGSIVGATLPSILGAGGAGAAGAGAAGAGVAGAGATGAAGAGAAGAGGLGTAAGVGAIGAAGVGSALLSRAAEKKVAEATGSDAAGLGAGIVASPIGAQINFAKNLVTDPKQAFADLGSTLGIGKGKTANGAQIAAASTDLQSSLSALRQAKAIVDSGQATQEEFNQFAQPILADVGAKVQDYTGRGSAWAHAINQTWNAFLNEGFVSAQDGKWVMGKNGPVLWSGGSWIPGGQA